VALRKTIATERDQLASDRDKVRTDQTRLTALVDERQRQQASREKDLDAENSRAIALSRQVGDLQGLIAKMEQDLQSAAKAAEKAAEAAKQAEAKAAANAAASVKPGPGVFKDRSRTTPAIAFASAKGLLPLPVNGNKIRDFGGSDGVGGVQKGISLATKPGSQVTTPCDCWVVYSGPFRSYGQLLILNAGGGYHVLIAGMERISVNIGQFVLTGEPVASMGSTSQVASILATNASQPVLYVEFRKDWTPIDPGPWWATNEGEKVRG
jgi:septal ring factor EnvC (AmiA/AmiB activator)